MTTNTTDYQDLITKVDDTWYCFLHWEQEATLAKVIQSAVQDAPEGTLLLIQTYGRWAPAEARLIQLFIDPATSEYRAHNVFTDRLIHRGECDLTDDGAIVSLLRRVFPVNSKEEK